MTGQWFSPVSSTNKTDHHDITENIVESGIKHHQTNKQTNKHFVNINWYPKTMPPSDN
jgi:hypothetical protein